MPCTNMNAHANRDYLLVLTFMTVVIALHSSLCDADSPSDSPSQVSTIVVSTTAISPTATIGNEASGLSTSHDFSSENSSTFYFSSTLTPSEPSISDVTTTVISTALPSSENTSVNTPLASSSPSYSVGDSNSAVKTSMDSSAMTSTESFSTDTHDWSSNTLDTSAIYSSVVSSTQSSGTITMSEGNSNSQGMTSAMSSYLPSNVDTVTTSMTSKMITTSVISVTTSFTDTELINSTAVLETPSLSSISSTAVLETPSLSSISSTPVLETSSLSSISSTPVLETPSLSSISSTPVLEISSLSSIGDTDASINVSASDFTMSVNTTVSSLSSTDVTFSAIVPTSSAPLTTTANPTSTPTTTTPSTTTQVTTTSRTTTAEYEPVEGNHATAIFTVTFELVFYCTNFDIEKIQAYFAETVFLLQGATFKPTTSCSSTRRRKRDTSNKTIAYDITAKVLANKVESFINETEVALLAINESIGINVTVDSIERFRGRVEKQSYDLCEADNFCPSAFKCKEPNTTTCYFLCDKETFPFDCENGECYVEVEYTTKYHTRKCRCDIDEFYQYEGEKCDTKKMTWQMILAIAGGCAAAIIVILIFIIIITCMRKKRRNNGYKYSNGSELNYTDLHNRSTTRIYQGLRPSTDRTNTGNAQGYENKAYDYRDYIEVDNDLHYRSAANGSRPTNGSRAMNETQNRDWNPEESADVYAKLNTRFDDVNYQYNIKRAQLRTSVNDTDVRTGF
ncbi:A-agglutinin anchorage subunit-like [Pecten maximus]|uniref:A-agglutinin anchorage subunit-like n=1 Tax=Pecten maximus TaxID=6579 RepID=UPI001458F4D0|nr:A-agglutinin anchorage subunit-like [Pecten maximus]XP_033728280.1 A-agglutinin anchorage subunit-like [Pecten maximus]XP_033728281.1 A-agglutinin anchorage subunit-like [Pecten maximus]